jgi:hypothetical protein
MAKGMKRQWNQDCARVPVCRAAEKLNDNALAIAPRRRSNNSHHLSKIKHSSRGRMLR